MPPVPVVVGQREVARCRARRQGRRSAVGHSKQIRATIDKLQRKFVTLQAPLIFKIFQEIQDFSKKQVFSRKSSFFKDFAIWAGSGLAAASRLEGSRGVSASARRAGRVSDGTPGEPGAS